MALTKQHEDFARDVVAVAKRHGMDQLRLTFQAGFDLTRDPEFDIYSWGTVEMTWSQPREGEEKFQLKAEQRANFPVTI